jgi:hypothetical protein
MNKKYETNIPKNAAAVLAALIMFFSCQVATRHIAIIITIIIPGPGMNVVTGNLQPALILKLTFTKWDMENTCYQLPD